jgi:hypothetical protein
MSVRNKSSKGLDYQTHSYNDFFKIKLWRNKSQRNSNKVFSLNCNSQCLWIGEAVF